MVPPSICDSCARIPFRVLRLPLTSEIPLVQASELPNKFPYVPDASLSQTKINIGHLSDLKARTDCQLCSYIWETLSALNVYTEDGLTQHGAKQVMCRADIGQQFCVFRYPEKDSDNIVTLFRLAITTFIQGHPYHDLGERPHFYMDNHFQVCEVGAGSGAPNPVANENSSGYDKSLFSGRIRPLQADLVLLRHWLKLCEEEHGDICNKLVADDTPTTMPKIRFIDVKDRCLVTIENVDLAKVKYLALSYVWGKPPEPGSKLFNTPPLALDSRTSAELHEKGSFRRVTVPNTIEDLLDLADRLDVRYVWVDRVCIQQDSNADKGEQISNMHLIYNCSHVTIIAAAGEGPDHGLPGLRPNTRKALQREILVLEPCASSCNKAHEHDTSGLSLLTTVNPVVRGSSYLGNAAWSTRGWTLQERFMARRSLIFTQEEVRFVCSDGEYSEEMYSEVPFPRLQAFSLQRTEYGLRQAVRAYGESSDESTRFWNRFGKLVERFTSRSFTFAGDAHDGFAAISQALTIEAKDRFVWGIPASQFELGLLWTTYEGQVRRRELTTLPMTDQNRRVTYPSWSWMGWIGPTSISLGPEPLETLKPTVECYVHRRDESGIRFVPVAEQPDAGSPLQVTQPAVSWGLDERPRGVSMGELKVHAAGFDLEQLQTIPMDHVIFFWASMARLKVSSASHDTQPLQFIPESPGVYCNKCTTLEQHLVGGASSADDDSMAVETYAPNIVDADGRVTGSLARMRKEHWEGGGYHHGEHFFIVVGRRHIEELGDEFPATLSVLQIEKRDGIWYRVSLGEVEEGAWEQANPIWSLIVLG